jgi:hypothetical protein
MAERHADFVEVALIGIPNHQRALLGKGDDFTERAVRIAQYFDAVDAAPALDGLLDGVAAEDEERSSSSSRLSSGKVSLWSAARTSSGRVSYALRYTPFGLSP